LLHALPIAAAIIERDADRALKVTAHNQRFFDTVCQSSCTALDLSQGECLRSGPIAERVQGFFDGKESSDDLDFKDGEGISAHYFRMKLAPLPPGANADPRCLSVLSTGPSRSRPNVPCAPRCCATA
jgi:hypothetical protein